MTDFLDDTVLAPLELKFADNAPAGEFGGYAAVFGNVDSHGDVVRPGAFAASLAERKASARPLPMHLMHRAMGGDGLPVGVWHDVSEDAKGLKVRGKISGMNTDAGRLIFERVRDGALGGLSIGYSVNPGGAIYGKDAGQPRRTLTNLRLSEISLVDDPSNPLTRVESVKRIEPLLIESKAQLEDLLQSAGVSRAAARKLAAGGYPALGEPDAPLAPTIDIDRVKAVLAQHERDRATPAKHFYRNN